MNLLWSIHQQFKINLDKMKTQICDQFPLLQPVTVEFLEEISFSEMVLQTIVKLKENDTNQYELALIDDDCIIISSFTQNSSTHIGFIRLSFSLKFQRILCSQQILSKNQNLSTFQHKGLKLIDDFSQQIVLFFNNPDHVQQWASQLFKYINQLGFHKYFKPLRTLGKGSSATVYEIVSNQNGKRYAAKTFSKDVIKNNSFKLNSFVNQLEVLRNIDHPNLLKVLGVYQSENSYYVLMQTLTGGNLFQYLIKRKKGLTLNQIKIIVKAIISGLSYLENSGIIHRDIKLENIMLRDKNTLDPVIVDFGLAVYADDDDYVYYQCGTPGYLSPETLKLQRNMKLTPKSDIFSVGVILHVLLLGRYLFDGKQNSVVLQNNRKMLFDLSKPQYLNLDKDTIDLLGKMLQMDPNFRISASQILSHKFLEFSIIQMTEKSQIVSVSTNNQSCLI